MKFSRYGKFLFPAIFVLSFLIFLAHTSYTKTALFADGRYYYVTTRSLVKDYDIDFVNEYKSLGMVEKDYEGPAENIYPPGVSLFWIPLFWTANNLAGGAGFNLLYQSAVALTNIFLGTSGLYLVYVLLKEYFSEKIALLTAFFLFAATNLLFYIAVEPINSHAVSFFVSTIFIFYFLKYKKQKYYYLFLGLLGGIAGLVRTQDSLILILPVIQLIKEYYKNPSPLFTKQLAIISGFLIGFLPQLIFWKVIFGNFWYSPYFEYRFSFLNPKILYVLFNTQNGLFALTPVVLIAFIGLFIFKKRNFQIALFGAIYFLIQLYIISAWQFYYQGGSYAIRMLITTYPLLAFGLAEIIDAGQQKFGRFKSLLVLLFLSLLNSTFILRYLLSS